MTSAKSVKKTARTELVDIFKIFGVNKPKPRKKAVAKPAAKPPVKPVVKAAAKTAEKPVLKLIKKTAVKPAKKSTENLVAKAAENPVVPTKALAKAELNSFLMLHIGEAVDAYLRRLAFHQSKWPHSLH